jgi:hypothetical protein
MGGVTQVATMITLAAIRAAAAVLKVLAKALLVAAGAALAAWRARARGAPYEPAKTGTHGTARWADPRAAGLTDNDDGFLVGLAD